MVKKAKQAGKAVKVAKEVGGAIIKSIKKGKEGQVPFKSVAGHEYRGQEHYLEEKSKRPNTRFMKLLAVMAPLVVKGVKEATIKVANEKILKERHYGYVAETLPNAVLDALPQGKSYRIANKTTKEMPKMDGKGKPTGQMAKKGLIEFNLVKI